MSDGGCPHVTRPHQGRNTGGPVRSLRSLGGGNMEASPNLLTDAKCAALRAVYEEISRAHESVASFRAKLLALLPLASGTGLLAILSIDQAKQSQHLLAIGIFGAFVTFALYMYEMRGIQRCGILRKRGQRLEEELIGSGIEGAFAGSPAPRFFLAANTWAARIIYPATTSVWAYVAFCGVDVKWEPLRIPLALLCFLVLLTVGQALARIKELSSSPPNKAPADGHASRAAEAP